MPTAVEYEMGLLRYVLENKDVDVDLHLFTGERRELFKLFRRYYDEFNDLPSAGTVKSIVSDRGLDTKIYDVYTTIKLAGAFDKEFIIKNLQDDQFERLIKRALAKYNSSERGSKREKFEDFINYLITERHDVSEIKQGYVWQSSWERYKEYQSRAENPRKIEGTPVHIKPIDEHLGGAVEGRFNVFFGLPKTGKTTMLMNIADNLASLEGEDVIFISGEMPKRDLEMIIDAKRSLINSKLIRNGSLSESFRKRFRDSLEEQWKKKSKLYIVEPTINFTCADVLSYVRIYEKTHKPKKKPKVFIDYLWLMDTEKKYSGIWDKLEYISNEIYQTLCRRLGYNVWSCTHESLEGHKRKRDKKERGSEGVQGSSRILPNVSALIMMDTFFGGEEEDELVNKMLLKCDAHSNRHGEPFVEYVTYLREFSYIGNEEISVWEPIKG